MMLFKVLSILLFLICSVQCKSQEIIKIPDNFVHEGLPNVSTQATQKLEKYKSRGVSLMGWANGEKTPIFLTRAGDFTQLFTVAVPRGPRKQLSHAPWGVLNGSFHPREVTKQLVVADSAGTGLTQLFIQGSDSNAIQRVSKPATRNLDFIWSKRGNLVAYRSIGRNGSKRQVYITDPLSPQSERLILEAESGSWFPLEFSQNDKQLLVLESRSISDRHLWMVDVESGKKIRISPTGENFTIDGAAFSWHKNEAIILCDWKANFSYLGRINLDDSTFQIQPLISTTEGAIESFKVSPNGKLLAYLINASGISRLKIRNIETNRELDLPSIPVGIISSLHWTSYNRSLGFTLESAHSPSEIYSIDIAGNKAGNLVNWRQSEAGQVDLSEMPAPRLICWTSFDNLMISGFLYQPSKGFKGKRPVIIDIHGGPELQARPGFLGSRDNYFLNELGIAMIFPNIRGSAGYGKKFLGLDNGMNREHAFKDLGALLSWIKTQPDLDPKRVMVSGVSYGAGVTLAVSYLYGESIRCSWAGAPTSNYKTLLKARPDRRVEYGDDREEVYVSYFDKIAPRNHASEFKKPVFLLVGANDPITPPSEGEEMLKVLKQNKVPVWYLKALDEGHGFTKKANLDIVTYLTIEFVKRYLLND